MFQRDTPALIFVAGIQHGQERLLRDFDLTKLLHPLLAFFLLFQQLALTADITPVALGSHVLADGGNRFASDDTSTQCGLNRDLELMSRDLFFQLLAKLSPTAFGLRSVNDTSEGVDL